MKLAKICDRLIALLAMITLVGLLGAILTWEWKPLASVYLMRLGAGSFLLLVLGIVCISLGKILFGLRRTIASSRGLK